MSHIRCSGKSRCPSTGATLLGLCTAMLPVWINALTGVYCRLVAGRAVEDRCAFAVCDSRCQGDSGGWFAGFDPFGVR